MEILHGNMHGFVLSYLKLIGKRKNMHIFIYFLHYGKGSISVYIRYGSLWLTSG